MIDLRKALLFVCVAALPCAAQVKLSKETDRVKVEINGKPFGEFYCGPDEAKPYFYPLRSASGKIVTRQFPMVKDLGESSDHLHHRGMWLGYISINGTNFWENEASYHRANAGRLVTKSVVIPGREGEPRIQSEIDWVDQNGQKVLTEHRMMVFHSDRDLRIIDFDSTLTAAVKAVFGDDKDGAFGIRIADGLTEKTGTGVMRDSKGDQGMKATWGKPADWLDYSGTLDGEPVGIAIFDSPKSFHHPARWHSRDYGLVAANPFADHAYDPSQPVRDFTLEAGATVHLLYRVVVHGKLDTAGIQKLYDDWTGQK